MRILKNEGGKADGRIFNVGHPENDRSIRELAEAMVRVLSQFEGYEHKKKSARIVEQSAQQYYGDQYQDITRRVPSVRRAQELLGWTPKIGFEDALRRTIGHYVETATLPDHRPGWAGGGRG
jgi:UDP-4-amino-4-deoxy-L-arabinose formyltransferase/UDP-glucuronic acid dehydrogenase (UDP-4-keto-hexauronic acid decarboxylating)